MIPVVRLGDMHVCPIPGHGTSPISSASPDTQVNFLGAARVGDVCGCGAVITTGFPSIVVDYRPLAYLGSPTNHGGTIISGSPDTFGGFQFGGAATQTIVDFAKLGAVRPDGSVDDQLMAELMADPHLEQRALLSGALVQPGSSPSPAPKEPLTPELIAVAGSQHDSGSGNKMMFIGQAVRELAEFKRTKPALSRTLVVFTPSYNAAMLGAARKSADAYGAGFVKVTNVQELIDYLNRGKDRKKSPIEHLSLFSHGVPHRIAFGYQLGNDFQMSLDVLSYAKMSPLAFSSTAQIDSYACRTGMGNRSEFPIEDGIGVWGAMEPKTNVSPTSAVRFLLPNHPELADQGFLAMTRRPATIRAAPTIMRGVITSRSTSQAKNIATTTLPLSIRATVATSPTFRAL